MSIIIATPLEKFNLLRGWALSLYRCLLEKIKSLYRCKSKVLGVGYAILFFPLVVVVVDTNNCTSEKEKAALISYKVLFFHIVLIVWLLCNVDSLFMALLLRLFGVVFYTIEANIRRTQILWTLLYHVWVQHLLLSY